MAAATTDRSPRNPRDFKYISTATRVVRIRDEIERFTVNTNTVPELLLGFAVGIGRCLREDEIEDFVRSLRSAHEAY